MREKNTIRILHLEDNVYDGELLQSMLESEGLACNFQRVDTQTDFVNALDKHTFDLILSDFSLPAFDGLAGLKIAREKAPHTPYIFVSGAIGEERAIDSLKQGATDYILKDNLARFVPAVRRAIMESDEKALRLKAEEDALQKDRRFRSIVETTQEWIWEVDLHGVLTYSNPAVEDILNYSPESLIGTNRISLVHENDRAAALAGFQGSITAKKGWSAFVLRLVKKDGSFCWVESNGVPVLNSAGEITGFNGSDRDITDRLRSEQTIREQARLLDVDPDAIVVEDLKGNVLFWSKGAERMLGWKASEILGTTTDFTVTKESELVREKARRTVLEDGQWKGEITLVSKQGMKVSAESQWTLVRDEEGNPKAIYTVTSDITEKKRIEAQLYRVQRMESIGTLAGGIAHDLNNVLGPILLASEALKKQLSGDSTLKYLHAIESSARRGVDMVKQVLTFARGANLERSIVVLSNVIGEMEKIILQTFPKNIKVSTTLTNPGSLLGDPTQIHQVILNLCVNARDAMPSGGHLTISVENENLKSQGERKAGKYVVLKVSDTGVGMSQEIQEKIFDPFFTSKEVGKGTGIGLSTVKSIVRNHGGFLSVLSTPGKGSTFIVYLPAHLPAGDIDSKEEEALQLMGQGELVLIVDDEASFREIAKETLETFGYRTLSAVDGPEALLHYVERKNEISVVIVDMVMPLMDGAATIDSLRSINSLVKIIAIEGVKDKQGLGSVRLGGETVLLKPFTSKELLITLKKVIAQEH